MSTTVMREYTLIGNTISNRYRILRELGSGGMAWVYLAEDLKENQLVAVKVLYPQFGEDLTYIQRFNREAKLASTLTDPHIVRVLDYGSDRDIHYLVMEYIEGENLRDLLEKQGPFPWRSALEIIDQLATALEHAHQYGIVHRDIKPQNLMLTEGGLLKVLDFGIARIPMLPSLTQSGFIGSPYYVSPEQAMGEEIDTRSDIYSAGIVLYELLTGRIPFDAKSPWSIINQHISSPPPPLDIDDREMPESVSALLNRMVAKRPEDRFPNPGALRRAINAVLSGEPIPDSALDTQPITPPDKRSMADSLYQRAVEAMEKEEWSRAVDLLNQALDLVPSHPEASKKLVQAEQQAFIASLYNAGKKAVQGERWEEAIASFKGVLDLDPDYKDTAELLKDAQKTLETINTEQLIESHYKEGLTHMEAERWQYAIQSFEEVQRLSPHYKDVDKWLATSRRNARLGALYPVVKLFLADPRRSGIVIAGTLLVLVALVFGVNSLSRPTNNADEHLKALYQQAQQLIAEDNPVEAVAVLDTILAENPNYADVAALKRDLLLTLTPAPTPTPVPQNTPDPLAQKISTAQEAVQAEDWSTAIDILQSIRQTNPDYEETLVSTLLCDALAGRGLDMLNAISPDDDPVEKVSDALTDFQTGQQTCPRRTDLQEQAARAEAFLEAVNIPATETEKRIQLLNPIIAVDPNYAGQKAKSLLYDAYITRGDQRRAEGDVVGALSDYEAALALRPEDPSVAQRHRAELLLSLGQQQASTPPPTPTSTTPSEPAPTTENQPTPNEPTATPSALPLKYPAPTLIAPENDTIFPGKYAEVILAWEPVGELAPDEYYDVTVMYIFADEPTYWGTATRETQIQLKPDIGFGRAGNDRFYWWVTVRKANTAPTPDSLDLPLSPQSEGRSFIWVP